MRAAVRADKKMQNGASSSLSSSSLSLSSSDTLSQSIALISTRHGSVPIPNRYRDIFKCRHRYQRRYYKYRNIPNIPKCRCFRPQLAYFHDNYITLTVIFLLWSLFRKDLYVEYFFECCITLLRPLIISLEHLRPVY